MKTLVNVQEEIILKVPLKKLNDSKLTPQKLFASIMQNTDFSPVIYTILQENKAKTEKEAKNMIEGFVQWLSTGMFAYEKKYLMFHGPVDDAFHSAILNTRWYKNFCDKNFGCFVHHNPFDQENTKKAFDQGGVEYTIGRIKDAFGSRLNSEIKKWEKQLKAGQLTAASVSCPGNDYE